MKRIWIAGASEKCENYQHALHKNQVTVVTSTKIPDLRFIDGLLLPGGGDIEPAFFGQENKGSKNIDVFIDQLQFSALALFVLLKKPVLGICKGLQIMNTYFGGDIIQDLPSAQIHSYIEEDQFHPTQIEKNSYLDQLYGRELTVNSAHHQGIGRLGKGLFPVQTSKDGVIEGIAHDSLPIYGVQWHPERMEDAVSTPLFQFFLNLC